MLGSLARVSFPSMAEHMSAIRVDAADPLLVDVRASFD
jgi:hypothetical protein